MSKISNTSAYPTTAPADGDLLIGTDINDSNATKTFTIGSVVALTPADTLAEVLTAGNTATNNIVLTGNITCTTIIPANLQDAAGNTGTVGQHLVKNAANALEWGAGSADTLANVLAAGNSAANSITLTGATGIITSTVSVPTDIRDNAGNFGTAGQSLKKSAANALAWETVGDNTLAEVLAAGNTATNSIILTGDITATNYTATALMSSQTMEAAVSLTSALGILTNIQDTAASTGTAGQYLAKSSPGNALVWKTVSPTAIPLADVLTAGNTATNNIILTGDFTGTGNITRTGTVTITGGISSTLSITSGTDIEAVGFISADTYLKGKAANALKLPTLQAFANEAAAAALTTGDVYQTDGTAAAPLNVAGILMIKQ
tara:strand:- start:13750 stop:14880 length:1131 start_codon:yes stop_codon:yes gene_type:complete